jgi:hypothetical protein
VLAFACAAFFCGCGHLTCGFSINRYEQIWINVWNKKKINLKTSFFKKNTAFVLFVFGFISLWLYSFNDNLHMKFFIGYCESSLRKTLKNLTLKRRKIFV